MTVDTEQGRPDVFYHGTNVEAALLIQAGGFRADLSGTNAGARLGPGVYCTTTLQKAMQYCKGPHGGIVFELQVDLGKCKRLERNDPLMTTWQENGYDSAWAPAASRGSGLEENCIKDPGRIVIKQAFAGHTFRLKRAGFQIVDGRITASARPPVAEVEKGADVGPADDKDKKDNNGKTALMEAASSGQEGCVRELVGAGADVGAVDHDGRTALMKAASKGHEGCVRELMEAGADWAVADNDGDTALMWAAMQGHEGCVRELLGAGAEVGAANKNGRTALMWAAKQGHQKCVRELVGAGADVGAVDHDGRTALMKAASKGHEECVRELARAGADVLRVGDHVELLLLQGRPEYNGKCGTLVSFDAETGRWQVQLRLYTLSDGNYVSLMVKAANLTRLGGRNPSSQSHQAGELHS